MIGWLTGALKLVGESFPWQEGSQFVYTQDNHNSVLGIRELALDRGASATCVELYSKACTQLWQQSASACWASAY